MTQLVQLIEECSPCWIAWSAVATIVPSSELISSAMATTEKIAVPMPQASPQGAGHRPRFARRLQPVDLSPAERYPPSGAAL